MKGKQYLYKDAHYARPSLWLYDYVIILYCRSLRTADVEEAVTGSVPYQSVQIYASDLTRISWHGFA